MSIYQNSARDGALDDQQNPATMSKAQKAQFVLGLLSGGPEQLKTSQLAIDLKKLADGGGMDLPETISNKAAAQLIRQLSSEGPAASDRAQQHTQKSTDHPSKRSAAPRFVPPLPDQEHPAIVAHRLHSQSPQDRQKSLGALQGRHARQVKFLLWQLD